MLKKYLFFALLILAGSRLEAFEIPTCFYIDTPKIYTVGDSMMNIRTDEKSLGLIRRQISGSIWSRRIPQYEFYSAKEGIEAIAKIDSTDQEYRVIFSVLDKNDQPLGRVDENWEKNYFSYTPLFEIYSLDQKLLAIGRWDFRGYALTLTDPLDEHTTISLVSEGKFLLGDYSVLIEDSQFLDRIDFRLLILTLAIATDKSFHYKLCGYKPSYPE